jgi:hypothetical protein
MKRLGYLLVGALALLLASCATPGFERAWKKSVSAGPAKTGDVVGPWTGEWTSDANGHTGKFVLARGLVRIIEGLVRDRMRTHAS